MFSSETETKPVGLIDFTQYTNAKPLVEKSNKRENRFTLEVSSTLGNNNQPHFLVFDSEVELNEWFNVVSPLLTAKTEPSNTTTNENDNSDDEITTKTELIVPNSTEFFHTSSTYADFRALPIARDQFISVWKEIIVGHDADGSEKWKLIGWGKCVAVHPEGNFISQLLICLSLMQE